MDLLTGQAARFAQLWLACVAIHSYMRFDFIDTIVRLSDLTRNVDALAQMLAGFAQTFEINKKI